MSYIIKEWLISFLQGLGNSFTGFPAYFHVDQKLAQKATNGVDNKLQQFRKMAYTSSAASAICLGWMLLYYYVFVPVVFHVTANKNLISTLDFIFEWLWSFLICWFIKSGNIIWNQIFSSAVYGTPQRHQSVDLIQIISSRIADIGFTFFTELVFVLQAWFSWWIWSSCPGVPYILYTLHYSVLLSLYACEYKWCCHDVKLFDRLAMIQSNTSYYIGFGLPMALLFTFLPAAWAVPLYYLLFPFHLLAVKEPDSSKNGQGWNIRYFGIASWTADKMSAVLFNIQYADWRQRGWYYATLLFQCVWMCIRWVLARVYRWMIPSILCVSSIVFAVLYSCVRLS